MRYLRACLALVALASFAACGNERVEGTSGKAIDDIPEDLIPSELMGLPVTAEDMSDSISASRETFVEAVGLYSMRRDELVQATLQAMRFNDEAPMEKPSFRTSLVSQIGGRKVESFRMGEDTVFRTTGRKQVISLWFKGDYMFVLSVRDTFEQPRTMLREALEIEP